jgi:hypothetical protein
MAENKDISVPNLWTLSSLTGAILDCMDNMRYHELSHHNLAHHNYLVGEWYLFMFLEF